MQQTGLERRIRHGAMQALFVILALSVFPPFVNGQSPATPKASNKVPEKLANEQVFYVESWQKGSGQVKEKTIHVEFHNQDETYKGTVEDAADKAKYRLIIVPVPTVPVSHLLGWNVELYQGHDHGAGNSLLRSGRGHGDSISRDQSIAELFPEENPGIQVNYFGYPISAKRVIKVENFYCIIQVKGYRLLSNRKEPDLYKRRGFAWISIDIVFSNTYAGPRDQH